MPAGSLSVMGRRIDVELTSAGPDGVWTWRAAGARQPKGVVAATLLYPGASVGDVIRAEADFEIEGISITAVQAPKGKKRTEPERLEIIGPPRAATPGVTTSLTGGSARFDRPDRGDRRGRSDGPTGPRRDRPGDPAGRSGPPRREAGSTDRGNSPRSTDNATSGRAGASGASQTGDSARRPSRNDRPGGARPLRAERPAGDDRPGRGDRPNRSDAGSPPRPKPKRLAPSSVHRDAVLAALEPEQQPIAEQVLRGGIPAVRQAVAAQNARLRESGEQEVKAAPLVAMAEQLLPQLKAAEWRDRAEAAALAIDEIALRDLRSVVAGADSARDDEGRLLAGTLRQALDRRVSEHRQRWLTEITSALDEGRLVRALRASARPPDAVTRFPAELAVRLGQLAGEAMSSDAPADRWLALLDAVAESPIRRSVKPAGLPAEPSEDLLQKARQASGRVPALAPLLGITMPPPPGPPRPANLRPRPPRRVPPPPPSEPLASAPAAAENEPEVQVKT